MKKFIPFQFFALLSFAFTITLQAQPQAFSYQALVRDGAGATARNQAVSVRIRLHQDSIAGTVVYSETHSPTTNGYGNMNLAIGRGAPVSGTFSSLTWISPMFIEIGVDANGGTNYTDLGTTQLLSVPYALYAGQSAPLGQSSTYYGAGMTTNVSNTDTAFKVIGMLSQTITVPAGMTTLFQTNGWAENDVAAGPATSELRIGLFIDGVITGQCKVFVLVDTTTRKSGDHWNINFPIILNAGIHTVQVMVRAYPSNQTPLVTNDKSSLTVTFLKN